MKRLLIAGLVLYGLTSATWLVRAQEAAGDGPRYSSTGALERPADYREWVHLTSGLGMTYGPAAAADDRTPMFDNVYVNRESYRRFMATGEWPEKTMFILEIRRAEQDVSINNGGRTQGALVAIEAAVKDSTRFPRTTWAYFTFGGQRNLASTAAPLPETASCYACHREHAAVEQTFVQFYPTLFEVARQKGTINSHYDPARKP